MGVDLVSIKYYKIYSMNAALWKSSLGLHGTEDNKNIVAEKIRV